MATPRRLQLVFTLVLWLLGTAIVLSAVGAFAYGLFVLLSVLGFVVIADLQTLSSVRPRWDARLRWFVAVGLLIGTVVVCVRLLQVLAPGYLT